MATGFVSQGVTQSRELTVRSRSEPSAVALSAVGDASWALVSTCGSVGTAFMASYPRLSEGPTTTYNSGVRYGRLGLTDRESVGARSRGRGRRPEGSRPQDPTGRW